MNIFKQQDILSLPEQGKILHQEVAILNSLGYVLAHDKYGIKAKLKLVNHGRDEYNGQIIKLKTKL